MLKLCFIILISCSLLSFVLAKIDLQLLHLNEFFDQTILAEHNKHRARHGSAPLIWHPGLAAVAAFWANMQAFRNKMYHSKNTHLGENLFYTESLSAKQSAAEAVTFWYDEIADYDYGNPGFEFATSHFTQVVWKSTTHVGCGQASSGTKIMVACNYYPAGNVIDKFSENVLPCK